MKGFHAAQMGHIVPLFSGDATGGHTTAAFSLKGAAHVSIVIAFGTIAAAPTAIILNQCIDANGDSPQALPFNIFCAETVAANAIGVLDSFGPRVAAPATGYVPPFTAGVFYCIEVDASELTLDYGLPTTDTNYAYLQVQIQAGAHTTPTAITAILSGLRNAEETQPSVLV